MQRININYKKRIGAVIYIVEGEVTEVGVIETIFNKILGYKTYSYNKNNDEIKILESRSDKYSNVFVIPAKYPQIKKLSESEKYFIEIYRRLEKDYYLDTTNSPIYFLFDRDKKCNRPKITSSYLLKYGNSRDNGENTNGLFLLSYPCVESFLCNMKDDNKELKDGQNAKEYTSKYNIKDMNSDDLIRCAKNVINKIQIITKKKFDVDQLDDFRKYNLEIFNHENNYYNKYDVYDTLSLVILSLLDLNVLEIEDIDD